MRRVFRDTVVALTGALVAAAALLLAPVLMSRGLVLVGDMSFVPFQPWKGEWLGLGGSPPRAVPADAIVSALTHVVPGDLVQKAILVGSLLLAGLGMLRLLGDLPGAARFGGALLYVWNPYVFERLLIGHWGLLVGYGAMPWVVRAALRVRHDVPGAQWGLLLWLAVAAAGSPTGGLLAAGTALAVTIGRSARSWTPVLGSALLVNLPWLLPGLLRASTTSDPRGVTAFGAAADTPLGLWGSLLGLGGIWKQSVVPGERGTWLLATVAALVTLVSLAALLRTARSAGGRTPRLASGRLLLLALAALLLAGLPGTGPGATVLQWLVERVPGAGLLRDSQKLLLPLVLAVCVGFALVLTMVGRRIRADGRVLVPVLLALLPVALLPSMAWGLSGQLEPVDYPEEWTTVRQLLDDEGAAEDRMLVLPWAVYRSFAWNGDRAVLDPAIRFFPGQVVAAEDLVLDDLTVRGDGPLSSRVGAALESGESVASIMRENDVRWLLVEKAAPLETELPETTVRHDGPELALLEMHGVPPRPEPLSAADVAVLVGDALVIAVLLAGGGLVARRAVRHRSHASK